MFSTAGFRSSLEDLIGHLRGEVDDNSNFQVRMSVEQIIGQMQRLRMPITRRDKGSSGMFTAAAEQGLDVELILRVERLAERAGFEFEQKRQAEAILFAEKALKVWNDFAGGGADR